MSMKSETDASAFLNTRDVIEGRAAADPALVAELERALATCMPQIRSVIRRFVKDPAQVEDLAQDTVLQAYRKLSQFEGKSALSTWMCGIAKYLALNAVRKKGELLTTDGVLEEADEGARSALHRLSQEERGRIVREASVAALDPLDQEIVYLRYVECLGYDTIESVLDLEGDSARVALQRIKRRLQTELRRRLAELGHGPTSFIRTRTS